MGMFEHMTPKSIEFTALVNSVEHHVIPYPMDETPMRLATVLDTDDDVFVMAEYSCGNCIVDYGHNEKWSGELIVVHKNNLRFWTDVKSVGKKRL